MKNEIVDKLKTAYNRDTRKQIVKSIIREEKSSLVPNYQIINQIFSYVLSESNWSFSPNSKKWDSLPLDIMQEVFPKIEKTKWYKQQVLEAKGSIDLKKQFSPKTL